MKAVFVLCCLVAGGILLHRGLAAEHPRRVYAWDATEQSCILPLGTPTATAAFVLENTGTSVVVIDSMELCCGLSVDGPMSGVRVEPGERYTLAVTMHIGHVMGKRSQDMTVHLRDLDRDTVSTDRLVMSVMIESPLIPERNVALWRYEDRPWRRQTIQLEAGNLEHAVFLGMEVSGGDDFNVRLIHADGRAWYAGDSELPHALTIEPNDWCTSKTNALMDGFWAKQHIDLVFAREDKQEFGRIYIKAVVVGGPK